MTTITCNVQHFGERLVVRDQPTTDHAAASFRLFGGFYGAPIASSVQHPTTDSAPEPKPVRATADERSTTDSQEKPMHSMIYGFGTPGRAELIAQHQRKILAAERRQQGTADQGAPMSPAQMNARARQHFAKDVLLTTNTPAEQSANASRIAALSGTDLGRVWDAAELTPERRSEVMDAVRRARDAGEVSAIMERYGFHGGNWSASANGTMFVGRPGEQGSSVTEDAARRMTGFQDADRARTALDVRAMQAANVASRR